MRINILKTLTVFILFFYYNKKNVEISALSHASLAAGREGQIQALREI
ncbi:MAG: hypothetical protein BAJATHORv1_10304 [Candidatus Thorarchaeota archaeon]|nr:MAG: hypothetical protein BAJATHORv1_10304 [Candidatus Thorarchaeota archaeon]